MKKTIIALLLSVTTSVLADDLTQRYEKAYFLETAKGKPKEAMEIYEQIVATSAVNENRKVIIQSLERMLVLHKCQRDKTFQSKVDNFVMHANIVDRIINVFGEPKLYLGRNTVYTRDHLPKTGYTMIYPDGFSIAISGGKILELRFEKPNFSIGGITIGSKLEDVLTVFPTEKPVATGVNRCEPGVIYKDQTGSISYKSNYGVRFTIIRDKVYSLNIYNTDLLKKIQTSSPKIK